MTSTVVGVFLRIRDGFPFLVVNWWNQDLLRDSTSMKSGNSSALSQMCQPFSSRIYSCPIKPSGSNGRTGDGPTGRGAGIAT